MTNSIRTASMLPCRSELVRGTILTMLGLIMTLWLQSGRTIGQPVSTSSGPDAFVASPGPTRQIEPISHLSTPMKQRAGGYAPCCGGPGCSVCSDGALLGQTAWSAGADFLLVRPHFSEAVGFARGLQTLSSFQTQEEELEFGYDGSVRATIGYSTPDGSSGLNFTYWRLEGETSVHGGPVGPGEFIVDPFGNAVGSFVVIDPSDARFGTLVVGGDLISARSTVEINVYDISVTRSLWRQRTAWTAEWSVGARIADIDQFYASAITDLGGTALSGGEYSADFIGAGPKLGANFRRYFGASGNFSTFVTGSTSLLIGQYDVLVIRDGSPSFQARQSESLTRTIPVFETELGAAWHVRRNFNVSLAWLFQAWIDLGASGGQFDGVFAGADDGNVMSFDGLVVRAELLY